MDRKSVVSLLESYQRYAAGRRLFEWPRAGGPPGGRESDVLTTLVEAIDQAVAPAEDRPLPGLLAGLLPRLDECAARELENLVALVPGGPPGRTLERGPWTGNLAYQALTWWLRVQAKREHHYHLSGNADPQALALSGAEVRPPGADAAARFAAQKRGIDASLQTADAFLRCLQHVVENAFADGCPQVELRFNPFEKPYGQDLPATLCLLHERLSRCEEAAAAQLDREHAVRITFSINRAYGPQFAGSGLDRIARILDAPRMAGGLKRRLYGWDLAGEESFAAPPSAWTTCFHRARELGFAAVLHLGDTTFTDIASLPEHLDYVEQSLACLGPVERIGHGMLLAPQVERPQGRVQDASRQLPRILEILRQLHSRNVLLETAPTPTIRQAGRREHRVYFWQRRDRPLAILPVADEIFQYGTTLSQWLADLLLLAPADCPSWPLLRGLQPHGAFLRAA